MSKMIINGMVALGLVCSLNVHAFSKPGKDGLAEQCHHLSDKVSLLVASQQKRNCMDKLEVAASSINFAGDLILQDESNTAKVELEEAVFSLQYAELNNCNRYLDISHAKFEAQKIRSLLAD